jgi:Flp pilus assembly protein TadD
MTYELTVFVLVVVAATVASWAIAASDEPRLPVAVKRRPGRLSSRTVRGMAVAVLGTAIVVAGALGVLRWSTYDPLETGAQLLAEGKAKEAVRVLVNVLAARSDDARAHYYLGAAYARLGVAPAALTHLKDAVRLAPREPEYRVALAGALIDAGDIAGAVAHLRDATELRPTAPEIRLLLARTLKLAGDRDGMLHELREVMRLEPDGAIGEIARQETRHLAGGKGHE